VQHRVESDIITRDQGTGIINLVGPFRVVCADGAVLRASSGSSTSSLATSR
jgi:hypothetical protein